MTKQVYTLYDKDSGIISQSNIVYSDENGAYGRILNEREANFINYASRNYADLSRHFVDNERLCERPEFKIRINKTTIKAHPTEGVIIRRIPKGVQLELCVIIGGRKHLMHSQAFDGPDLEIPFDVPGIYSIAFNKHPYKTWERIIEVTE